MIAMVAAVFLGLGLLGAPQAKAQCPGDITGSGEVDVFDLLELLACWGPVTPDCEAADLTASGTVDVFDLLELLANWGPCPVGCGAAGTGDCCEAGSTPYCDDAACCELVCADDPFCCNTEWDGVCASQAVDVCEPCFECGSQEAGDCFSSNPTPFCDDAECCELVCDQDAFCCNTSWDSACANQAGDLCIEEGCGHPDTGDCFSANATPFCDNETCCETVCALDAFCCNTEWDDLCAEQALDECVCGNPEAGSCCESNGSPGCDDAECCEAICADDPFCCNSEWDNLCADAAADVCVACFECGSEAAGNCCESNGTPYCDDAECCELICAQDSFCCNNDWDGLCAEQAVDLCELCFECGSEGAGSCCESNGTPYCDDAECCELVCAQDSFCCNTDWDNLCANQAVDLCEPCFECGSEGAGDCFSSNNSPFCNIGSCCELVCADDPFCCDTDWDGVCANAADADCVCGHPDAGDCCSANNTPGCTDAECCDLICADDPFCCDSSWDSICADAANDECAVCN